MPNNDPVYVVLTPPVTTNGGVTTDYISMKNVHKCRLIATFKQAASHATSVAPKQATAVDGTGVKVLSSAVPIWANTDVSATSVLTRQTDAVNQACASGTTDQIIVMDIDPAGFDHANGFDCLGCAISDSSQATNFVSVVAELYMRYPNVNVITD